MVTAIVPDWPGARLSGVYGADAPTADRLRSPGVAAPAGPDGATAVRPDSRASTKKSFCRAPVFSTWIAAVTGCPAGSTVAGDPGRSVAVTGRVPKPIVPLRGSRTWSPVRGGLRARTSVQR